MSDSEHFTMSYTSISSDSNPLAWGISLMDAGEVPVIDPYEEAAQQGQATPPSPAYVHDPIELEHHVPVYVPELVYPEYLVPSDDDIPVEDPEEDLEEDPKEDLIDYVVDVDEDEDGEEESSKDDDDEGLIHCSGRQLNMAYPLPSDTAYPIFCPIQQYSKEEVEEAITETMEQYMIKTRTDYGSGVARPKINNKDQFELKEKFLKELQENTFSDSDNEDANEHIEKVLEIVDLFHVPNIIVDQLMLQEVILFYNELDILTRQIIDSRGAIPTMTGADAKKAIQEMAEYSQKWHNGTSRGRSTKTSDGLAAIQAQLNNLGREIKKNSTLLYKSRQMTVPFLGRLDNHYCEVEEGNYGPKFTKAYGASHSNDTIPQKEKDPRNFTLPCFINNTCFDNSLVDLGASVSVMPLSTYLNLVLGELAYTKLIVELADRTVKYPKGIAENVLVGIVLEDMDAYRDEGIGDIIDGVREKKKKKERNKKK
ncbi:hypothetical protein Tco_0128373 [Tanacetum coccineum]